MAKKYPSSHHQRKLESVDASLDNLIANHIFYSQGIEILKNTEINFINLYDVSNN